MVSSCWSTTTYWGHVPYCLSELKTYSSTQFWRAEKTGHNVTPHFALYWCALRQRVSEWMNRASNTSEPLNLVPEKICVMRIDRKCTRKLSKLSETTDWLLSSNICSPNTGMRRWPRPPPDRISVIAFLAYSKTTRQGLSSNWMAFRVHEQHGGW